MLRSLRQNGLVGSAIATAAAFAMLMALGSWQMQRKAWKEGLLAQIAERTHAPPVALATLLAQGIAGCYLHVATDILELGLASNGTAISSLSLPNTPWIVGLPFYHQMVLVELDALANVTAVTSTNSLRLAVGAF